LRPVPQSTPLRSQRGLGLDCCVEGVGDVEAHELEPPLGNVADGLLVVDDVL
jgi:hypothetical protein